MKATKPGYATLDSEDLRRILKTGKPSVDDAEAGFVLVSVRPRREFERERIPGSIHVSPRRVGQLADRFDAGKKIVVYSASSSCPRSAQAAEALTRRGFRYVFDYVGGMRAWKRAGHAVERPRR
jgi:rhodanese-related sulfurtransferase